MDSGFLKGSARTGGKWIPTSLAAHTPQRKAAWSLRPKGKGGSKGGKSSDGPAENRVLCTDPEEQRKVNELKTKREELASRKTALLANLTSQMKVIMAKLHDPNVSEAKRETLRTLLLGLKEKLDSLGVPGSAGRAQAQAQIAARSNRLDHRTRILKFHLTEGGSLEELREELRKLGAPDDQVVDLHLEPSEDGLGSGTAVVQCHPCDWEGWPGKPLCGDSGYGKMLAALVAVTTAAGTKAQAAPWADGRWYDASPYFNLPIPVCKLVPKCVQEGTCGLGHAKCPKNFEAFQGYCYRALPRSCVYEEAIQRCRDGNLFVRHICGNHFCWIGLAEEPQGEDWHRGCEKGLGSGLWLAGGNAGKLGYWNWAKGEPNNGNGLDETVAIMNFNIPVAQKEEPLHWVNGLWYDVPVHFALGQAICEQKSSDSGECPENWRSWGISCYRFFHWPANFQDAEDRCRESSAFLASISSDDEQYFVQDLCGDHMCWLGLEEKKGSEYWKWVDGLDTQTP
eukprot:s868_g1.t1